jgi:hypothetical protein
LPFPQGRANWRRFLKIFEFSAVPSRRAELKNYSQRNSFELFTPATGASPVMRKPGKKDTKNGSVENLISFNHSLTFFHRYRIVGVSVVSK